MQRSWIQFHIECVTVSDACSGAEPRVSSFIYRLARTCYRARVRVAAAWLLLLAVLAGLTLAIGGTFDDQFSIPGASSQVALDQLRMTFPEAADSSATILVLAPAGKTMDDPAVRRPIEAEALELEKLSWVSTVQLPYNEYIKGLISDDQTAGLISVMVPGGSVSTFTDAQREVLIDAAVNLQDAIPGSEVHVGGDLFAVSMPRVTVVELAGVGVAVIVLIVVLGSLTAAMMPIAAAAVGAGASLMLIVISAGLLTINSTTMILALMLALAVGIDYSLFIVSRHRDQLATGMEVEESAARATATAGSAVVFAGMTVIVALVGLAVAGLPFLTIMGVFAAIAVALEVVLALTLLPALLGFAGERLRPRARSRTPEPGAASRWWVGVVTRAPLVTTLLVIAGLTILSWPAQDLELALPNSGRNPPGAPDRVTFDLISERFGVGYNGPLVITGTIVESTDPMGILDGIRADVEAMPGVKMVALAVPNANADTALVQIIPTTGPDDPATARLVEDLRAMAPTWQQEYGIVTSVTGFTAASIDVSARLADALLPFGLFVVGLSLVLLTMVFRSIWVPLKAALGYLLSIGGAFGATTLVFNKGWFIRVINLPETLPVISFLPIILMGILFGLAMDYEVFLTSRMREEYVHGNRTDPVEAGFVHSAKVVVAAAIIMIAVFAFFVPAGEGVVKPIAFGLAVGVAIDAFLVRMTLGPAVMKLLGERAWWLPGWLSRHMPVMDIEGEALTQQLRLADWPVPGSRHAVYGEGLGLATGDTVLFAGVDLELEPGQTLLVTGAAPARSALLLALTGRLRLTSGELKVLGRVLPQEAADLRRCSTFVTGTWPDAESVLAAPVGDLVVVDDADRLSSGGRAALSRLVQGGHCSVVVGAADEIGMAEDLAGVAATQVGGAQ